MPAMIFAFLFKVVTLGALGLLMFLVAKGDRPHARIAPSSRPSREPVAGGGRRRG